MIPSITRNRNFAPRHATRLRGLSLLELLVVLVIVTATALIVIPTLSVRIDTPTKNAASPDEVVTQHTLTVLRDAMVGEDGVMENLAHKPEALPHQITELLDAEAPEHVQKSTPELAHYDPMIGIGWRGPYLIPTGRNELGLPTVVDGWGNEVKLQIDFDEDGEINQTESQYARVVSSGPNGLFETPGDLSNMKPGRDSVRELTMEECGDDVVLFLRTPDIRQ
ncbi:MAG: hypothetical protein R3C03_07170 [Pirellulaceae bacterium]